ncbi:thaumatin-like protein 1 [Oryza brachyantha]|uniref:thaumatin-like protein 1 n=1 Tax=Oryza brachyantha TaxID=4533 RepID=UPI001ADD3537|nr:thaumatin-like protein 1 [Oryza brachyantha]
MASSMMTISSVCFVVVSFFQGLVGGVTFTFTNRCGGTVWPGVLSNSGSSALETTGFALGAGERRSLAAPAGWSGRFWARTGCAFDGESGKGACATGDCGSGEVECRGAGAAPPATLVEFTLDGSGGKDYYDVSLVDGYNLPVVVEAASAAGCPATGCVVDLNERCPAELKAGQGQACRSACEAFGTPEYCCSGQYGNPDTCHPSVYSQVFKAACPRSYSYAYDDATSTFTCAATDYSITFCPRLANPNSQKSSNDPSPRPKDANLEDDSWLASLATGEVDGAAAAPSTSSLLQATLAVAVMALLALH